MPSRQQRQSEIGEVYPLTPVRILLIDDNPDDRALAARGLRLRFPGCVLQTVGSEKELEQALAVEECDLVITDYHLPWTDGLKILHRVRQRYPGIPVIIYTGTGNEKVAAQALKEGADDYVIKTAGRVPQLIMASRLALERSAERRAAFQARAQFERFSETLPIGWFHINTRGVFLDANPYMAHLLGYPDRQALLAAQPINFFENDEAQKEFHRELSSEHVLDGYEVHLRRADGSFVWSRFFAHPVQTADGQLVYEAVVENIQARKDAEQVRMEKEYELRRTNESLRAILDTAPTAIIGLNTDGIVDYVWNKAAEQLMGKTRQEAFGQSVFQLVPEMAARSDRILTMLAKPSAFGGRIVQYRRSDGEIIHLNVFASSLSDPEDKPAGMIAILMDVTERKAAEGGLRLNQSRLSLIFESVSDLLFLLAVEGDDFRVVMVNQAVANTTGIPLEQITGRRISELLSALLGRETALRCRDAVRSRQRASFISSTRLSNATRMTTENTLTPILDSEGRCTHILLVARDIHARIKSEMEIQRALNALRESEHRYRTLAEAAPDMIFILDRAMRVTYVNSFASTMMGRPAPDLIGRPMQELFPPAVASSQTTTIRAVLATGEAVYREQMSAFPRGEIWLGTWLVPMRDPQGNIVAVMGLARNITERVHAEQALRESEEQYRSLVQTSPDAILLHDLAGNITFANQQGVGILGYASQDELNGRHLLEMIVPEERQLAEAHLRSLVESGSLRNIVHTILRKDGTTVPMEVSSTLIRDSEGQSRVMVSFLRDITERRHRERALQESEARFRAIFEKAAIGAILLDRERRLTECNAALCDMLGYTRDELLRFPLEELTLTEDRLLDQPSFGEILGGQLDHYRVEKRLLRKDGGVAWCRLTISAVRGSRQELLFLVGMIEDITKQREAEQATRRASEELRRYANRLKTLHEIDQAILQADSTEEIARATLEHMSVLLPCQRSSLVLFDLEAQMVTILGARTQMDTKLARGTRIPFTEYGSDIERLKQGQLVAVDDFLTRDTRSPAEQQLLAEGIRTVLSIPLINQGTLIGALNIASGIPGVFTREHAEIAQEVANLLAVAIQQARLLEQVHRHTFELEAIAALNQALRVALTRQDMLAILIHHVTKALSVDLVGLLNADLVTEETYFEKVSDPYAFLEGCRIPPSTGMTGHALASNQPFRNNDPAGIKESPYLDVIHSMRAIACMPLITRGYTLGAIWIGRTRKADPSAGEITDADLRLLASIGDIAANAIHRATLHDQTEQRLRRLAALRAVDMAISASIDLRVSLSVLLDQVTAQLQVDAADILILDSRTQSLAFSASRGFHSPDRQRPNLPLGQGFAGVAALERRVVSVPRLEESHEKFADSLRIGVERFASYFAAPLIAKGQVRGVMELYSRTSLNPDPEWLEFLETMAAQAAIAIDNSGMFEDLQRTNTGLVMAYDATIEGWSRTLELRDRNTSGHTERVTELTVQLARRMGIREANLIHVRRGTLMHDIGKMAIPDSILLKPGPLTPEEWVIMRQHPVHAYELLYPITYLRPALDIPYDHHEKWDGSGYPRGLAQEQIPLAARVFAVVDVWDALRSDRPYRPAWPEQKVHEHLREQSGTHFDSSIVGAFLEMPELHPL